MASRNDRRPARQGTSADPQVPKETDIEPDRHDGSLPPRRSAWLGQAPAGIDWGLRALDPRISVRAAVTSLVAALALASCGKKEGENAPLPAARQAASTANCEGADTPMAQRVAVLGILNKRKGIVQTVSLHPGQSIRWKDVIVRLRACEATAPWEAEKLTGAFVQVDVQQPDKKWARVFSGWLYKESPSLNVVEHPVYDVWPKSCEMTYPAGPAAPATPASSSNLSSARKSGTPDGARPSTSTSPPVAGTPTGPPPPRAAESNAT